MYPGAEWVHGGARGFDTQVDTIAKELGKTATVIRPDYNRYPPKIAPLERNKIIVDTVDLLVACYDGRKKGGTYQTVNYAEGRNVVVYLMPISGV